MPSLSVFPPPHPRRGLFQGYVGRFGLAELITFRTASRPARGDLWTVELEQRHALRALIVANGRRWDRAAPRPPFPGSDQLTGTPVHAHSYLDNSIFADEAAVVPRHRQLSDRHRRRGLHRLQHLYPPRAAAPRSCQVRVRGTVDQMPTPTSSCPYKVRRRMIQQMIRSYRPSPSAAAAEPHRFGERPTPTISAGSSTASRAPIAGDVEHFEGSEVRFVDAARSRPTSSCTCAGQVLDAVHAKDINLPVIIVTGTGSEDVAAEAIKRGAADYVIKTPSHIQRLPHTIHAALEKKQLEIEHQLAEQEIHRRLMDLQVLYQSTLELSRRLAPAEIGRIIIGILKEHLDWHHAIIRLKQEQGEELEIIGYSAPGVTQKNYASEVKRINNLVGQAGLGMNGWVIQHGQALRSGDLISDPRYIEIYPGIHSGLYAPMLASGKCIGAIAIESESANAFNELDEQLLVTLAKITANAIHRNRLGEQTENHIRRLGALRAIDQAISASFDLHITLNIFLKNAITQLGVDAALLLLFNPSRNILEFAAEFRVQKQRGQEDSPATVGARRRPGSTRTPEFEHSRSPCG